MDWEDLHHFLALAQAGTLSEAARGLRVDHTTVARRVAALEAALGLRLIERLPRRVTLTPEGRRIAQLGGAMEDGAFAILRAATSLDQTISGSVRLSGPPNFASVVIAPRLPVLRARHPGIVVDLIGDQRNADLDRREADIALRLSRPGGDGLVGRRIGDMRFGLYAAPFYVAARAEAEWEIVAHDDHPVALPQQRWLNAWAEGRPIVVRANDTASLAAAARAGLGVALLPDFLGNGDPGLVRVPCADPPPCREIWMVVHDDLRRTPRIRAVMDFLIEALAAPAVTFDVFPSIARTPGPAL